MSSLRHSMERKCLRGGDSYDYEDSTPIPNVAALEREESTQRLIEPTYAHTDIRQSTVDEIQKIHLPQPSTNYGKDAFSFTGPKVWNSLPREARQMNSLHGFTTFVRTHLNSIY